MKNNHKWFVAGFAVVFIAVGIIFSAGFNAVIHWAGSTKFCGEFCHSMDAVYVAYQKGSHARNSSGVTAGCSDCHLLNESKGFNNPVEYSQKLLHKSQAGLHSLIGEIKGELDTPEKQIEKRDAMAKNVTDWMIENRFSTCLGCHDFDKVQNPAKPFIPTMHKNMLANKDAPVNCIACHPSVGHNYKQEETPAN